MAGVVREVCERNSCTVVLDMGSGLVSDLPVSISLWCHCSLSPRGTWDRPSVRSVV